MPDFAHHMTRLLALYTYPVLLGLVLLESLGIPLPGEIALVTAAAYASHGHVSILAVMALAAAGASVGGVLGYLIGLKGGLPLVAHYGGYVGIRRSHLSKAHEFFERYGSKTILFGRFIALLRTWAAVVAGAAAMSFPKFVTYNTIGSVVWAIVFGAVGYYFGRDLPLLHRYISGASFGVFIVAAIALLLFLIYKRQNGAKNRRPGVEPDTTDQENAGGAEA
ncbi:MAG TPA: DedA family protein [Gemmatimonadaceae bacterium]